MAFDGIVVASLASELKHKLLNGRISKIRSEERRVGKECRL